MSNNERALPNPPEKHLGRIGMGKQIDWFRGVSESLSNPDKEELVNVGLEISAHISNGKIQSQKVVAQVYAEFNESSQASMRDRLGDMIKSFAEAGIFGNEASGKCYPKGILQPHSGTARSDKRIRPSFSFQLESGHITSG